MGDKVIRLAGLDGRNARSYLVFNIAENEHVRERLLRQSNIATTLFLNDADFDPCISVADFNDGGTKMVTVQIGQYSANFHGDPLSAKEVIFYDGAPRHFVVGKGS